MQFIKGQLAPNFKLFYVILQFIMERLPNWFGFWDTALAWIASCLHSGTVAGSQAMVTSHMHSVSVLGPLLFLLYATPLSHHVQARYKEYHLFANDTAMTFKPLRS